MKDMQEQIFILIEFTRFYYQDKPFTEKRYYYRTFNEARKVLKELEIEEELRKAKSKRIDKIPYVERTSEQKIFNSNNSSWVNEYKIIEEKFNN